MVGPSGKSGVAGIQGLPLPRWVPVSPAPSVRLASVLHTCRAAARVRGERKASRCSRNTASFFLEEGQCKVGAVGVGELTGVRVRVRVRARTE